MPALTPDVATGRESRAGCAAAPGAARRPGCAGRTPATSPPGGPARPRRRTGRGPARRRARAARRPARRCRGCRPRRRCRAAASRARAGRTGAAGRRACRRGACPVSVHPSMLNRGTGMAAGSISLTTARRRKSGIGASRSLRWILRTLIEVCGVRAVAGPGTCTVRYMTAYDDDLRLAHVLADTADSLTMSRFRAQDLVVETKPDLTPVSDADKRGRGGHPVDARPGPGRATPCTARRCPTPATARGAGCSTRSTAPRTSSAGCRCGPP